MLETTVSKGYKIEQQVKVYLMQAGLAVITSNYRCQMGEIDLIMREQDATIVFVEVRFRDRNKYGDGAESINFRKKTRIIKAAKCFLQQHGWYDTYACRFDVVAVTGNNQFTWIKDAFWMNF